jgi:cellulose synthase/poly-beta-1,6-N-acetylglucosamine synthase-like glycosyltransferase
VTILVVGFVAAAALLWLSVFGYLLALAVLAGRRHWRRRPVPDLPPIAVVMATLNEAAGIDAKLADLARSDYPADRLRLVIVDGGSTDGTVARIEAARAAGMSIELLRAPHLGSKLEQLRSGLEAIDEELVVATDADSSLDPGCIRALVGVLVADPTTAVVGARVRPATDLLEERLYWWFLDTLWWLEGEALSAAVVSGVCYAVRRRVVLAAPRVGGADDVLFALAAGAHGHGVRLCRAAGATETRVPHTAAEFLSFRRRRGAGYFGALRAPLPANGVNGWRLARAVRLLHFVVTPFVVAGLAAAGVALCASGRWLWPLGAAAAFALPLLAALAGSRTLAGLGVPRWRLGAAALRLAVLVWLSVLLTPRAMPPSPRRHAGGAPASDVERATPAAARGSTASEP